MITVGSSDISGVVVRLGKKGAILDSTVYGAESKESIAAAQITLRDAHNTSAYVRLACDNRGHFEYTVPSKPILISASGPG